MEVVGSEWSSSPYAFKNRGGTPYLTIMRIGLLSWWGHPFHAAVVGVSLAVQLALMERLVKSPRERAPWYNATGVSLYVIGMLVSAFALRTS